MLSFAYTKAHCHFDANSLSKPFVTVDTLWCSSAGPVSVFYKYNLLMRGINFESFTEFTFEWKTSIFVFICLQYVYIYILYLSADEALTSSICLNHD